MTQSFFDLGNTTPGIVSKVSFNFIKAITTTELNVNVENIKDIIFEVLVPLLMYGNVFKKQWKVIQQTSDFIEECGDIYVANTFLKKLV